MQIQSTRAALPKCVCASEHVKLIGTLDGAFPKFGHHDEREMGGMWMHPIKLLDGFRLRFTDRDANNVDSWILADEYICLPYGNEFRYGGGLGHTPVRIVRRQIAPDSAPGLCVTYRLDNSSLKERRVSLEFEAVVNLHPVWFSNTRGIAHHGADIGVWIEERQRYIASAVKEHWFAAIACDTAPDYVCVDGGLVSFRHQFTLPAHGCIEMMYLITGSMNDRDECEARLDTLIAHRNAFAAEKKSRSDDIQRRSMLTVPDLHFNEIWNWIKYNTDWLIIDAGKYGRGLAAGIPEYPWWFGCDTCYALQGVLAMGDIKLCRDTLLLLARYSEEANGDGRIPHEITTFGLCANPGNTQETAHFVTMAWHYYAWTGDRDTLAALFPLLRKSMRWLAEQDEDCDGFPSGYGIIEIVGLNGEMIDTAVYTVQAYICYADICALFKDDASADAARIEAERIRAAFLDTFWDDNEGLYCDIHTDAAFVKSRKADIVNQLERSDPEEAARFSSLLDSLIRKKPNYEDGWLINRNWIINTPMEVGLAPRNHADRALERMNTSEFIGPYGMYLSAAHPNHTMTISTGVMAVAQARYGYADRALGLMKRMFATFGKASPGTIAEMSPDYGCFVQAWTAYAAFVPVVRHFFGIQPDAFKGELRLSPCMPAEWETATIERVPVMDGEVNLCYRKVAQGYRFEYCGTVGYPVRFNVTSRYSSVWINGEQADMDSLVIVSRKFSVEVVI
jgi:glycogen debranching enzyme